MLTSERMGSVVRRVLRVGAAAAAAVVAALVLVTPAEAQSYPPGLYAEISTSRGIIVLSLDFVRTPMTVANFVGLAEGTIHNDAFEEGRPFFDGSLFDRVAPGHVIQGGAACSEVSRGAGYRIPNEIHAELGHGRAGMLGMANGGPHTASNIFYITLGDRSYLDGDYAVFGQVYRGLEVVMNIEVDDAMDSLRIVRVGRAAQDFRPTTESFRQMVELAEERVRVADEEKARFEAAYLHGNWPNAEVGAKPSTTSDPAAELAVEGVADAEPEAARWRYLVLDEGVGSAAAPGESITVRYSGHTPQGLEFASTGEGCGAYWRSAGDPAGAVCDYVVGETSVTQGLDAAIAGMKPGARWIVIVPSEIGYPGAGYYPPTRPGEPRFHISPNALLIYEVEVGPSR